MGGLTEIVPVHFNFLGQVDAFADKNSLLLLLGLNIFAYITLSWLARNPHKMNLVVKISPDNKNSQYHLASALAQVLKVQVIWLFAFVTAKTITIVHNPEKTLGLFFVPLVVTTIFATLVGYLFISLRLEQRT